MSDLPSLSNLATEAAKSLSKELYNDLGHPAVERIGSALGAALDIFLLPIHLLAYPATKTLQTLKRNLADFEKRTASVPRANLKPPPNEIAVPLLQRLSYVSDDDIRRLYIELLAKAADSSLENAAHPSFIHTIDRMSPDEARMLQFIKEHSTFPYVWIRMIFLEDIMHQKFPEGAPGLDLTADLTGIEKKVQLRFANNLPLYLTNCAALGLINRESGQLSDVERYYVPIESMYEGYRQAYYDAGHKGKQHPVIYRRGYYKITPFGTAFIAAATPL